jgi:hypothetical protein
MYTPAGFDLATHSSAGGSDTTRPYRQGKYYKLEILNRRLAAWYNDPIRAL